MASTCFSITGKKNQNVFFNRESYWDFKMGFILIALGSGLPKRKSRGFLVFYLALTQSLILEKNILNLTFVHVLSVLILLED